MSSPCQSVITCVQESTGCVSRTTRPSLKQRKMKRKYCVLNKLHAHAIAVYSQLQYSLSRYEDMVGINVVVVFLAALGHSGLLAQALTNK